MRDGLGPVASWRWRFCPRRVRGVRESPSGRIDCRAAAQFGAGVLRPSGHFRPTSFLLTQGALKPCYFTKLKRFATAVACLVAGALITGVCALAEFGHAPLSCARPREDTGSGRPSAKEHRPLIRAAERSSRREGR